MLPELISEKLSDGSSLSALKYTLGGHGGKDSYKTIPYDKAEQTCCSHSYQIPSQYASTQRTISYK